MKSLLVLLSLSIFLITQLFYSCQRPDILESKDKHIKFTQTNYPQEPSKLPEIVGKVDPSFIIVTSKNWRDYYDKHPEGMNLNDNIYIFAFRKKSGYRGYKITVNSIINRAEWVELMIILQDPGEKVLPAGDFYKILVEISKADLNKTGEILFVFIDANNNDELARIKAEIE